MGIEEFRLQPGEPAWYQLPVDEAVQRLRVDPRAGLGADDVRRRRERFGPNVLREGKRRGPLRMLAAQFTDFMILILVAAALISGLIGDLTDTIVILAIVVMNAAVGFVQEYRAERAVAALKLLAAPSARVLRDGEIHTLAAAGLVPGDIVLLEAGNVVPADLRLTETFVLKIDESMLTGESQPVEKHTRPLHETELPLGDRLNLAYKGTIVTYGRARGVVVATGMQTELGKIAGLLHAEKDARTPLQKRLTRFGRIIAVAVLLLCGVMFGVGIMRGEPVLLMLLTAISLAVAAIPEALPAVVTVALALGARRMVQRNVLIRRLPAVETLGSVTYICSDKTGTLTENRMRAEEIYAAGDLLKTATPTGRAGEPWESLFHALALSNDARRAGDSELVGDPTEVALYLAAEQAGYRKETLARVSPRIAELPFDSERARMTTLHRAADGIIAYTKGAPEKLLSLCRHQLTARGAQAFEAGPVEEILERMAADGLRVLAVAFRRWPEEPASLNPETVERDLTFLGLVGLMDPPRAEAADAVRLCMSAGITPVMITGDHPGTAGAVARRLDIIGQEEIVLTGQELARLDPEVFAEQVPRVRAYARVAPAQKIRIVQALQDRGEFVAMTGDGVNDAPALKRADIGIAMGKGGTDVAREASHMILLDDNFASIVAAVREGRRIFDNIRKFIKFIMTGNSGEILTLFLAPFLGLPIPLLPIHILWVNLVTDGLPGLALAVEPEERGIMRRPPRPPRESIFAHGMWQHIVWVGLLIAALCLLTQAWAIHAGTSHWQTMVFTVLTLAQMAHVLAVRSERDSLFTQGIFSNTPVLGAVLLTFGLQLATIYVPWLNPIFRTQPLSPGELAFCLAASSVVFVAVEIEKALIRRGWLYNAAAAGAEGLTSGS
jgi:Ca2+-transporting ATPase